MKDGVLAIAGVLGLAACALAQDPERVLPSRRCGDQFIVDAMINGEGPFALLVDTGCSTLVLSPGAAERLGGATPVKGDAGTPLGGKIAVKSAVNIRSLRIGEVELAESSAPVLGLDRMKWAFRQNIDGILGFDAFAECIVTFDFPAGQIRIGGRELRKDEGATGLRVKNHQPSARLSMGAFETEVVLDSGANGGLELAEPDRLPRRGEWVPVGAKVTVDGVRVFHGARLDGAVVLAGVTIIDPIVVKAGAESLVGCEVLRNFSWTFDQKRGLMLVKSAGAVTIPARRGVGMAVSPNADGLEVIGVFEGGPAEKAGLRKGDLITRVNGVEVIGMECGGWQKVMQAEKEVQLVMRRGGEVLERTLGVVEVVR